MITQSDNSAQSVKASEPIAPLANLPSLETSVLLKACVAPMAAIARYQEALQWSEFSRRYQHWLRLLDAIGTQQLSGMPVSAVDVLVMAKGQEHAAIQRLFDTANADQTYHSGQNVDASMALRWANSLNSRSVSLRRRASNQGELAGLPESFVPPTGSERLQSLLDDWQQFIDRDAADMNPLLLIGVAHAQFMCIRPFTFANTAAAHVILQQLLWEEGVMDSSVPLPMGWQFSHRASDYWQLQISAVLEQKWDTWLLFYLQKLGDCAERCAVQLRELSHIHGQLTEAIGGLLPSHEHSSTLAHICVQPSCGIGDVVEAGVAKRQTAANYLSKFVDAGLLREQRVGKEKRFINDNVLSRLLDDV